MKILLKIIILSFVSIFVFGQNESKIILKNGHSINSVIEQVYLTAVKLDSLHNNQIIMFSITDSIITSDSITFAKITRNNKTIFYQNTDGIIRLDFSGYKPLVTNKTSEENYYNKFFQINFFISRPNTYNIMLLNSSKKKINSNYSVGLEFLRSLSKYAFTGIRLKYTRMDYSFFQISESEKVSWQNDLLSLTGNVNYRLYEISPIEFGIQLDMGLKYSSQNYSNLHIDENTPRSYYGVGLLLEIKPTIKYSFNDYQLYFGFGYNWSGFNYVFYSKNNKRLSRYLVNDYDSMSIEIGIGYLL